MTGTFLTSFLLIRHGETDWNRANRWQGHVDIPLNDCGISQAKSVAHRLKNEHADLFAIYSSDLKRAHATALETACLFNLPIEMTPVFREYHMGQAEGMTRQEAIQVFGGREALVAQYPDKRQRWKHSLIPGQETVHSTIERCKKGMLDIASLHPGKKIAIFTHGGCVRSLQADLEDLDTHEIHVPNAALVQIIYDHQKNTFYLRKP